MTGVDFGNMNCYLAVARNKGIGKAKLILNNNKLPFPSPEILMNDYSLHATPFVQIP
jgi:hypothetical protein